MYFRSSLVPLAFNLFIVSLTEMGITWTSQTKEDDKDVAPIEEKKKTKFSFSAQHIRDSQVLEMDQEIALERNPDRCAELKEKRRRIGRPDIDWASIFDPFI